jgi:TRAP transporter 4TM/12TM fusion protein
MSWSRRGNPAKAAGRSVTLAGFLLGTVSGSGVATTVTLGSVAWPIMRRVGFAPDTAGGMLAASGIGALLSPPTLGAAAFLIAEYLRISYLQVLVMATIPTILYYLSIGLMIEGETATGTPGTSGTRGTSGTSGERNETSLSSSSYLHFSSLILVAALMVAGLSPFRAVFWAMLAAVAVSFVMQRDFHLTPRRTFEALAAGGKDAQSVIATTAVAGIIVGVVTLTGLGLKAAGLIVHLAAGSLTGTVVLSALAVWILGLAVPVTASYIISAVMVAPALVSVGVAPAAAHMFIFYYAVLSEVSPPTALAPFAAAAITGARPFPTMMLTWKYSLPAFIVPFAFTLDPRGLGLLLASNWTDAVLGSVTAAIGVCGLAAGLGGWVIGRESRFANVAAVTGGLLLFHPAPIADAIGLGLIVIALGIRRLRPAT